MRPNKNKHRSKKYIRLKSVYRRRRRKRLLRSLALLIFAAILCVGAILLLRYGLRLYSAERVNREVAAVHSAGNTADSEEMRGHDKQPQPLVKANDANVNYQYIGGELLTECRALYRINPDLVGWLNIPGELDLPVVYRDNSYYLTHDFYGNKNDSGTVFLDEAHPFAAETQYLFLHGHNVWDGSMLGNLTHYRRQDYFEENPYLYFNTLYRRETYRAFGVLTVSEEEMHGLMRLGTPGFENGAEFYAFMNSLQSRALRFDDAAIGPEDAILALSTCWEQDQRIVVLFHRIDRNDA